MSWSKVQKVVTLADATALAVSEIVDVQSFSQFCVQVEYGAGAGGDLQLAASVDGETFIDLPDSTQAMDVAGGAHLWEVTDCAYNFLRIDVAASASTTVKFLGVNPRRSE